jgi:putative ABC transport system permease protein
MGHNKRMTGDSGYRHAPSAIFARLCSAYRVLVQAPGQSDCRNRGKPRQWAISAVAMKDLVGSSWRLVLRNRRRYQFVMGSLAMGVLGFIVVVNVGDAVEKKMGDHLTLLGGATIIDVGRSDFDSHHPGEYTLEDVERLKTVPHVLDVAPSVSERNIEVTLGAQTLNVRLAGVEPAFWNTIMARCDRGRLIDASDEDRGATVCVLGEHVVRDLFGQMDPVGDEIHVANLVFTVVGVLGGIQGADTRRTVFIPLTTVRRHFSNMYSIQELRIRVDHWDEVEAVAQSVAHLLRDAHPGFEQGIRVRHYPERVNRVRDSIFLIKVLSYLASFAAVLIGTVGVTYLMLSSVIERTREVGLRKAVGATDSWVRQQFLVEGLIVCSAGALVGIGAGLYACFVLSLAAGLDLSPTVVICSCVGSLALMMVTGLAAAYRPAREASRMNPATAIRFQ